MARRSGRASMPPSVGGMQGMGASTTYFVPTKLRGKEAQEAVEVRCCPAPPSPRHAPGCPQLCSAPAAAAAGPGRGEAPG